MNGEYKYSAGIGLENTLAHTGGFLGQRIIMRRINQKEKDKKREEIKRVKGTFFILREG